MSGERLIKGVRVGRCWTVCLSAILGGLAVFLFALVEEQRVAGGRRSSGGG